MMMIENIKHTAMDNLEFKKEFEQSFRPSVNYERRKPSINKNIAKLDNIIQGS
jgi:hypothetical protein